MFPLLFRLAFFIIGICICTATWYFYRLYSTNQGDNYVVHGTISKVVDFADGRKYRLYVTFTYLDKNGNKASADFYDSHEASRFPIGTQMDFILNNHHINGPQEYSFYNYWGGIVLMGLIGFCFVFVGLFANLIPDWLM